MTYKKQTWRDYDDTKTEIQNLNNGAVVTPERMNHIETGIANSAQLAHMAPLNNLVYNDTSADNTNIINSALKLGKRLNLKDGVLTIKGKIRLDLAKNNSYVINGNGESTALNFIGTEAGLIDDYREIDGEDYHIKTIRDLYLKGDGTSTGFDYRALQGNFENLVFEGFDVALNVERGGYLTCFNNIYMVRNKFGVRFGDAVTTMTFNNFHARFHDNKEGSVLLFDGNQTEHISFSGSIEGNMAPAIRYSSQFDGNISFNGMYFELNGDRSDGIYSIIDESVNTNYIKYDNTRFPRNIASGRTSGRFAVGDKVVIENSEIFDSLSYNELSIRDSILDEGGGVLFDKPVSFFGINRFGNIYGEDGKNGFAFQLPPYLLEKKLPTKSTTSDPFSENKVLVSAYGANKPTVSIDSTNTFHDKKSTAIKFVDNLRGNAGDNSNVVGIYELEPNKRIVISFFIKGNKKGKVRLQFGGKDHMLIGRTLEVDENWRKYLLIARTSPNDTGTSPMYLYVDEAISDFTVNLTGYAFHNSQEYNPLIFSEYLKGYFNY